MAGDDQYYPGVTVIQKAFTPTRATTSSANAFGAFIGKSNQGPTSPYAVRSWPEFLRVYGSTYTDLHAAVSDFFANGGQTAYIQRIVGAAASVASVNVYANDAPQDPQNPGNILPGTPPLFTITALNPGAWGNQLHAVLSPRDPGNKRFDINIFRVPLTDTFDSSKRNSEYLVDSWTDLSLLASDSRYLYDVVNLPSATGSVNVVISGQSYDPATPGTRPYPTVIGSFDLAGGVDGSYVNISFNSDAAFQAGVDALDATPGPYILNIPNVTDPDVIRYAVNKASTRSDVFVVIDSPQGKSAAEMQSFVDSDLALGAIGTSVPSYAAVYYPWLYMPSIGSSVVGRSSLRPPGGAVIGRMVSSDTTYGVWQAPAGSGVADIAGAINTERVLLQADLMTLNAAHVNAIRPTTGGGISIMGARTLKKSGKDMYVPIRRTLIYIAESLKRQTEYAVFKPNGQKLWVDVRAVCGRFLGGVWQAGGLMGATAAEAYYVTCDATNNDSSSTDGGFLNIDVGVALATPAEFIVISIGQFDGGSQISTSV